MKNPLKLLFCQKSGYFNENPPIGTQNLTHKIQIRIDFFQKNLKIRARFARTEITFAVFVAARNFGYQGIQSLTNKVFLNFFVLFVYTVFPFFHEFEEIPLNPAYNSLHDDIPRNGTLQGINFFDSEEFLGSLHKSRITLRNSSNDKILFFL